MEVDEQVLTDEVFPSQLVCLKDGPAKIGEAALIAEAGSTAEVINDPTAIAGNILRYNRIIIINRFI